MKLKKLISNIVATVGMIFLILPLCLTMYTTTKSIGGNVIKDFTGEYGIFADWSVFEHFDNFAGAWATITDILSVVIFALAVIYVVLFALQLFKVGGKKVNYSKIMKILSFVILALTLVALITAIVFVSVNTAEYGSAKFAFGFGAGSIMMLIGGFLTGTAGLVANHK